VDPNLTEVEKAAVLLMALGPERAKRILDQLGSGDLLPIIEAMKRMVRIPREIRRSVLEEVNQILTDRAARRVPGARMPPPRTGRTPRESDLFGRLEPLLPDRIDPEDVDWHGAGFDFGEADGGGPRRPPGDEP
jgi:hypothetical protein